MTFAVIRCLLTNVAATRYTLKTDRHQTSDIRYLMSVLNIGFLFPFQIFLPISIIRLMAKLNHYVYMIRCKYGTLYTGYTQDLKERLNKHNSGKGAKYLRGRGPLELVYSKGFRTKSAALAAEIMVKKLTRDKKEELISGAGV